MVGGIYNYLCLGVENYKSTFALGVKQELLGEVAPSSAVSCLCGYDHGEWDYYHHHYHHHHHHCHHRHDDYVGYDSKLGSLAAT